MLPQTNTILQGALDLIERGYKVFPIGTSKRPACEGGFYAATDDQVRQWHAEGRLKNIGIATGALSGIAVTDADTPEAAEKLRAEYGEPTVESARGSHWYWKYPGVKVTSKPLGDRIDSKSVFGKVEG
jgi:hypothetical protein